MDLRKYSGGKSGVLDLKSKSRCVTDEEASFTERMDQLLVKLAFVIHFNMLSREPPYASRASERGADSP